MTTPEPVVKEVYGLTDIAVYDRITLVVGPTSQETASAITRLLVS